MGELIGPKPDPTLAAGVVAAWVERQAQRHAAAADGPWARTDGFEIGGLERRSSVDFAVEAETSRAELAWSGGRANVVAIDGKPAGGGEPSEIVWAGSEAFVLHGCDQMRVSFPDPLARQSAAAEAGGEVAVPMHGRIVAVPVAVGEKIAKGGLLFTLEAMKMEHSILRLLAGTVRAVAVAPGQQVEQGAPAIFIEPEMHGGRHDARRMMWTTPGFVVLAAAAPLNQGRWRCIS